MWKDILGYLVRRSGWYKEGSWSDASDRLAGAVWLQKFPLQSCLCPAMHKVFLVLALGVLLIEMRLGSEARTPPYGVKLCGREFIRAVIFT
ncbi:hypothetical protein JD844_010218 [Phrynosoma platyrhinos]|uniref:Uncharacterized protein n=1 Tax=Phrynosoma platyrhinos TaxID=52577 RepID=A0ABQ7TG66_PHRPL|nr:hypothetical protein JD844_010218 [Phrynosoma platyrhinos]